MTIHRGLFGVLLTAAACYGPEPPAIESGVTSDDTDRGSGSESSGACVPGTLDCPCDGTGDCEDSLTCVDSFCVDTAAPTSSVDSGSDTETSSTGPDVDSSGGGDDPWSEWTHHRELTISSQSDLVDHQVLIDLPLTANVGPGGADVRVLDADDNLVPLWVEGTADNRLRLWIKLAQLDAGVEGTYTIRYGNPDAPSVSDPHSVFELFDDFDALDDTRWNFSSDWALGAGGATTTYGSAGSVWTTDSPRVVEAVVRWNAEGGGIEASTGVMLLGSSGGFGVCGMPVSVVAVSEQQALGGGKNRAPVRVTINRRSDAFEIAIDDLFAGIFAVPIDGPYQIGLGWLTGPNEARDAMEIDRLFVRQYVPSPPSVGVGPEQ